MQVVVCPGMHEPQLTASFIEGLEQGMRLNPFQWLVFPSDRYPAYSGLDILQWLHEHFNQTDLKTPIAIIAFSAGVVGAIAAAHGWQAIGGTIQGFIALDGWGVPLWGDFPIHRLSHDHFTHWSSALLGAGESSFYAEPAVEHLDLWRSPHRVQGWQQPVNAPPTRTTAVSFIATLLHRYNLESNSSLHLTTSMNIKVEPNPSQKRLELLGVFNWDIWTKETSEFPWYYGNSETCYFLEGAVIVTPRGRQPVSMGKGDLVIFPAGMTCTWNILSDVKKHYLFS